MWMKHPATVLPLAVTLSLILLLGGQRTSGQPAEQPDKQLDTTIILRELARWDTDSAMDNRKQTFNEIWGWESPAGREYAIMGGLAHTYFIDITDPRDPELVAKKPGRGKEAIHRDYATYQHYCYAVTDELPGALRIYDLQYLPDSVPLIYDKTELGQKVHNVFQEDERLYLLANDLFKKGAEPVSYPMSVLSIEDPEDPELLSHMIADSVSPPISIRYVHDAFVRNDTVYASGEGQGLYIIDYTDPEDPELVSAIRDYPFQGYNHSSWLTEDGQTMVMADESHGKPLKIYDVSDPANPEYQAPIGVSTDVRSIPHNPLVKDDLAYVSYYHEGLQIFDISDPQDPTRFLSDQTYPQYPLDTIRGYEGCWGVYPFFSSGTVAASDMTNGLHLYRVDTLVAGPSEAFEMVAATTFRDRIGLRIDAYKPETLEVSLYNTQGRLIRQQESEVLTEGENQLKLEGLGHLRSGMYLLQVKGGGEHQVKRMIKAR